MPTLLTQSEVVSSDLEDVDGLHYSCGVFCLFVSVKAGSLAGLSLKTGSSRTTTVRTTSTKAAKDRSRCLCATLKVRVLSIQLLFAGKALHHLCLLVLVHPTDSTRLDLIIPGEQHFYVRAVNAAERQRWLVALGSSKAGNLDSKKHGGEKSRR